MEESKTLEPTFEIRSNIDTPAEMVVDGISGVHFPDGEVVSVTLRPRPAGTVVPDEDSPELSLLAAYELLTNAVNEDSNAAFKLSELQMHCRHLLADTAELSYADPNNYVGPWGMTITLDGSGQQAAAVQLAAKRHIKECGELDFNDKDWLRTAADLGSSDALKELGSRSGRTSSAVELYEQAWQAGEIYASSWLSHLHSKGFTSQDGQFKQDAIQAYAHQYLFASLLSLKYADQGGRNQLFARRTWEEVERMQKGLHPHELEEAYTIAKSLLHDECCMR